MEPRIGKRYSRREINKLVGGSTIAYLPHKDGQILCGCFNSSRTLNPDAPEEVVYGTNQKVQEMAEMMSRQTSAIPIFMFRSPGEWEYIGDYRCIGHSRDPKLVRSRMNKYPERGPIAGVLRFQRM